MQNYLNLYAHGGGLESRSNLPVNTEERFGEANTRYEVCAPALKCPETESVGSASEENKAEYLQEASGAGTGTGAENFLHTASVSISQEKPPVVSFNTTNPMVRESSGEYVPNALYGSNGWLSPHTAFEAHVRDPGIGVSYYRILGPNSWGDVRGFYANGECKGVQCPQEVNQVYNYSASFADGEDEFELFAEDAAELYGHIWPEKIKVDATSPHSIKVSGFVKGAELAAGESQITVEATDGETKVSSGVRSIQIAVDGREVTGGAGSSCSPGPCTASWRWTLAGRDYAVGEHELVVTATDNAGNVAKEEFGFVVHAASAVAVGVGSLNPESGELKLATSDVSMGGGLSVSRSYDSEQPTAGAEGPLGSQWSISLGGGDESLAILPDGSALLSSGSGGETMFARNSKGEFASPPGDGNLKLEAKEKEGAISEYLVVDAKVGTTTRFTLPEGSRYPAPAYLSQFGAKGSGSGQLSGPEGVAIDSSGNTWVLDTGNNRLEEFSPSRELMRVVGSTGSGAGQFNQPVGIAISQSAGNLYVTDSGNHRVQELNGKGEFVRSFGSSGSGEGQFGQLAGIAIDASGNVWVCDYGNDRVQEFSSEGVYESKLGGEGSGNGQFKGPSGITVSGGDLYVTDQGNNRVQELNGKGEFVRSFGSEGSGEGQLSKPYGIATESASGDLYVVDAGNRRVQEFSASGKFLASFGGAGAGPGQMEDPQGIATDAFGEIRVVDAVSDVVGEWEAPETVSTWLPTIAEGPVATGTETYKYRTTEVGGKQVIEPTQALAPVPAHVSCAPEMKAGCRALTFNYAEASTAKGEAEGEWGDYEGDMTRVYFTAWSRAAKEIKTVEVARYLYDSKGRLRAEWDPRIKPELKTIYGYDSEGHLTSATPAGQQGWALIYGAIAGDESTGRLLKVTRAQPQAGASEEEVHNRLREQLTVEKSTEAPKLTGKPAQGVRMAASTGQWSGSPIAYGYQWQSCNSAGAECKPIAGATNPNYTPTAGDVGHRLAAQVTAINGAGAVTVSSAVSSAVVSMETVSYAVPAAKQPNAITEGPDKNVWFTISSMSVIGKMTSSGVVTEYTLPWETEPYAITAGPDGNLWFTERYHAKIGKITTEGVSTIYSPSSLKVEAKSIVAGPDGNLWFTGGNKVGKITTSGAVTEYALPTGSEPGKITVGSDKNLWFTEKGTGKIGKITTSGSITEYALAAGSVPSGITAGPDENLWFTDWKYSKIGKITTSGTITTYSLAANSEPITIAAGADKNLWFTEWGAKKIGRITTSGTVSEYAMTNGKVPASIVAGPASDLWFTEENSMMISKLNPTPTAGASISPQGGSTIEYAVPLSGSGLPTMTSTAVAKWAQKDDPVEATAVFPPDEPQGWPAEGYKKATIYYRDFEGRTVNLRSPGEAIATSEYNESNDVVRSLSADNRAAALKEGSKSAEVSQHLDTESKYNGEGTELLETTGPEHKVKLSIGEEVSARNHVRYFYDEGAPKNEEYGLVTRRTDGALLSNGEEKDVRTTLTGYSAQSNLGWKLRQATSTTVDPSGVDLMSMTVYNKETGAVTETRSSGGTSEAVYPPVLSSTFGSAGSENGQLSGPRAVAIQAASGAVWVADTGNNRIEVFSGGKFQAAFGGSGSGNGQFSSPWGVADLNGTTYVADTGNDRVQELNGKGEYVLQWGSKGSGNGQFEEPKAVTLDSSGNVWVSDTGNNRVQEFTGSGEFIRAFGSFGSGSGQFRGPGQIAFSGGMVYVVDQGDKRVEEFTPAGSYVAQFGSAGAGPGQLEGPWGIATAPVTGDLYVSDAYTGKVLQFSPGGKFLAEFGHLEGLEAPEGLAVNGAGYIYVADQKKSQITVWQPAGAGGARMHYLRQWGSEGAKEGQFYGPDQPAVDASGNVWVSDYGNNRLQKFSKTGQFLAQFGSAGAGSGQFKGPTGVAVNQSTGNIYVADREGDRIEQFTSAGEFVRAFGSAGAEPGQLTHPQDLAIDASGNVWVADTGNNRVQEFSSTGSFIAAYGSKGTGNGEFLEPAAIAFSGGNAYVTDAGNHRVQELNSKGEYVRKWGSYGTGSGQFYTPQGISADAAGNLYVVDSGQNRVQEFKALGGFLASFASTGSGEGQLKNPEGIAITAAGDAYIADQGNERIQEWMPERQAVHDTKTIYYTPGTEASIAKCQNHPEWASLPCQTEPAGQPETEGLPPLPVTAIEYNMYGQPETTTETLGSTTRTKKSSYDEAGRVTATEETSNSATDAAQPAVADKYSEQTGMMVEQVTEGAEGRRTIASVYNTLGEREKYTDAGGNQTTYSYDLDGRTTEVNYDANKLAGPEGAHQTYSYSATTGALTELKDSAAGVFKATYDVEGNLASETYPNGMTATYALNAVGEATGLEYVKTTDCSSGCTWFSQSVSPSIHGEMLSQASTFGSESYAYDAIGRLTQVQETPAGEGCTTRLYAYDEESNRVSLTTRKPGLEGRCATEGGELQRHSYDEANRLTDEGATYDPLGNATRLPAADAGGQTLESSFYADNQVHIEMQEGKTLTYAYDPGGRLLETKVQAGTETSTVAHYPGGGEGASWISEGSAWTRQVPGIDGQLAATQLNTGTVALQLHDLQGNVVATASVLETETKLLSTYQSSEFGVPTSSKPPKYSWLGGAGIASQLPASGIIATGAGAYVPEIGRPLETEVVMPPALGAGSVSAIEAPWSAAEANAIEKGRAIERQAEEEKAEEQERLEQEEQEFHCGSCEIQPEESVEGELEAEELGGGEAIATASRTRSTYGCYGPHGPRYEETSFFKLIFNYSVAIETKWCGYAMKGHITSHSFQCPYKASAGWELDGGKCSMSFNRQETEGYVRLWATFKFQRGLSLSVITIHCWMNFYGGGYWNGKCRKEVVASG